MTGIKDRDQV